MLDPLVALSNKIISIGHFPFAFKVGEVIPIYEKSDHKNVTNYRPAILISILGKLLDTVLKTDVEILEKHTMYLSDRQFGSEKVSRRKTL